MVVEGQYTTSKKIKNILLAVVYTFYSKKSSLHNDWYPHPDEENRLLAVDNNGFVSNYRYDADGERTVKTSGESDRIYVNGVLFSGGSTYLCLKSVMENRIDTFGRLTAPLF